MKKTGELYGIDDYLGFFDSKKVINDVAMEFIVDDNPRRIAVESTGVSVLLLMEGWGIISDGYGTYRP